MSPWPHTQRTSLATLLLLLLKRAQRSPNRKGSFFSFLTSSSENGSGNSWRRLASYRPARNCRFCLYARGHCADKAFLPALPEVLDLIEVCSLPLRFRRRDIDFKHSSKTRRRRQTTERRGGKETGRWWTEEALAGLTCGSTALCTVLTCLVREKQAPNAFGRTPLSPQQASQALADTTQSEIQFPAAKQGFSKRASDKQARQQQQQQPRGHTQKETSD